MILTDSVEVAGTRRTRDGYLVADCRVARSGNVQVYTGQELDRPDLPLVRVYRDPDAIFDTKAMGSWAFKPMTVQHPSEMVTADNWRDHAVGLTGPEVVRDGEFVRVPMCLMDAAAIEAVESGARELSCGYHTDLAWEAGTTPSGEAYDAKVVSLVGNHIAIVARGRAGPECRIGDAARGAGAGVPTPQQLPQGGRAVPDETNPRAVLIDGLTIRTNDAGAEAITRLQRQIGDAATAADALRAEHAQRIQSLDGQIGALKATHADAIQAKDGELAAIKATHTEALQAKDGEITALKSQIPDAVALDAMLDSRMACADEAARVHGEGFDPRGKSEVEMRRIAVAKRLGDAVVVAMSDAEVGGAFRAYAASSIPAPKPDALRAAIVSKAGTQANDAAQPTAYQKYVHELKTAYIRAGKED